MPRVVPSDVTAFIDRAFSAMAPGQQLGQGNSAPIAALVALVERLPDELLTLPVRGSLVSS